jgi:DNA primase
MAHQHGFGEAVAVLGTALTLPQLGLLRRYADEAILFFDADRAGQEAARRAEDLLEQSANAPSHVALTRLHNPFGPTGLRLRVAILPAGHDPDTYLRAEGREEFEARCHEARSLLLFALDRIFADEDSSNLRGKSTIVARVALMLSKMHDADEAVAVGREAALRLGIDPSDLWNQAARLKVAGRPAPPTVSGPTPVADVTWFERDLCQLVLQAPEAREALLPLIDAAGIVHPAARAILAALRDEPALAPEALLQRLPDDIARTLLARWLVEEREWPDLAAEVAARRRRLERRQAQRRVREISQTVARSEASGATTDFNSLHAAIGQETPRIRADAGGNP